MKNALLIIIISYSFFACKKKEPLSQKDILTSHSWVVDSITVNGELEPQQPCKADDYITYRNDNIMTKYVGITLCTGQSAQESSYNYSFNEAEKTLSMIYGSSVTYQEVVSLTTRSLVLRQQGIYNYTTVYKPK